MPEIPTAALYGGAFVFGALWGSFLNVCIVRLPLGRSVVRPPSSCPACGAAIRFYDNVPILSWLWLRGRCRACQAPISPRYLAVELLTAVLSMALAHRYGLSWSFLAYFVFVAGLVVATFVDLAHFIIPNQVTYALLAAGLGLSWVEGATVRPLDAAIGAAAGAGGLLVLAAAFRLVRGVRGLGTGDVKLFAAIGAFLGWRALPLCLFLAAAQGVLLAMGLLAAGRKRDLLRPAVELDGDAEDDPGPPPGRLAVPFGPFLSLAALEVLFFGPVIHRAVFGTSL